MRTRDWLRHLEADPTRAWECLGLEFETIARAMVAEGRLGKDEFEDCASEGFLRVYEDGASGMREADVDPELSSWVRGVLGNVWKEEVRGRVREREIIAEKLEEEEARVREEIRRARAGESPDRRLARERAEEALTPKQREAWLLYERLGSISAVARTLKVTWRAVGERLARAAARLLDGPAPPAPERAWAEKAMAREDLDEAARAMLSAFSSGASHRAIAAATGTTRNAVKCRLRRLRKREGDRASS